MIVIQQCRHDLHDGAKFDSEPPVSCLLGIMLVLYRVEACHSFVDYVLKSCRRVERNCSRKCIVICEYNRPATAGSTSNSKYCSGVFTGVFMSQTF